MKFYGISVSAHSIERSASYRGANCISKLMKTLRSWLKWVYSEKQTFRWLQISAFVRQRYLSPMTISYCICGESVNQSERGNHHCHLAGKIFWSRPFLLQLKSKIDNLSAKIFPQSFNLRCSSHYQKPDSPLRWKGVCHFSNWRNTYVSSVSVPVGSYYEKNKKNNNHTQFQISR